MPARQPAAGSLGAGHPGSGHPGSGQLGNPNPLPHLVGWWRAVRPNLDGESISCWLLASWSALGSPCRAPPVRTDGFAETALPHGVESRESKVESRSRNRVTPARIPYLVCPSIAPPRGTTWASLSRWRVALSSRVMEHLRAAQMPVGSGFCLPPPTRHPNDTTNKPLLALLHDSVHPF